MYRRPKFLEELLEIREQMARDSFYDADLFAERVRSGTFGSKKGEAKTRSQKGGSKKVKKKPNLVLLYFFIMRRSLIIFLALLIACRDRNVRASFCD